MILELIEKIAVEKSFSSASRSIEITLELNNEQYKTLNSELAEYKYEASYNYPSATTNIIHLQYAGMSIHITPNPFAPELK